MAAEDHLNETQFFHGTRKSLPEGDHLRTALEGRRVHFTTDADAAMRWGHDSEGEGPTRVYQVHPEGEVQEGRGPGGYASRDPVRIGHVHSTWSK